MRRILTLCGSALLLTLGLQSQLVKKEITPVPSSDGRGMYNEYCAACHGLTGRGDGPAAKALKVPATDVTKLALHNDGEFPGLFLMAVLSQPSGGHGSSDMPVWRDVFRESGQDSLTIQARLYNLVRYLETLQDPPAKAKERKPLPPTVSSISAGSGGEMFRAYCASCHGIDGVGNGPAAWTLKTVPPDITLLLRQNNGVFPAARVREILTQGSSAAAHGTAEMPVWGSAFRNAGESPTIQMLRTRNLARYLESIQRR